MDVVHEISFIEIQAQQWYPRWMQENEIQTYTVWNTLLGKLVKGNCRKQKRSEELQAYKNIKTNWICYKNEQYLHFIASEWRVNMQQRQWKQTRYTTVCISQLVDIIRFITMGLFLIRFSTFNIVFKIIFPHNMVV